MVVSSDDFVMRVVKLGTHSLDLASFIFVSHVLVMVNTFKVNGVKVSEFPLLFLANPVDTRIVELLMILDLGY